MVATTHFIGDPEHPLWRYSDACIHQHCFSEWEHREEFVRTYNQSTMSQWHRMFDNGTIIEKSFFRQAVEALLASCRITKRST
jgi:hypothetical protein